MKYITMDIVEKLGAQISSALSFQKYGSIDAELLRFQKEEVDLMHEPITQESQKLWKQFIAETQDKYNLKYQYEKRKLQYRYRTIHQEVDNGVIIDGVYWPESL